MTSYSELRTFQRCPQAWEYKYQERLEPRSKAGMAKRRRGTWIHAALALEEIRQGHKQGTLRHDPVWTFLDEPWFIQRSVSWEGRGQVVHQEGTNTNYDWRSFLGQLQEIWNACTPQEQEELGDLLPTFKRAVKNWLAWEEKQRPRRILAVEQRLEVEGFNGVVDCVYEENGQITVRDYKTTEGAPPKDDVLLMDMQPALYAVLVEETYDIKVDFIEWVYIKVNEPTPPRFTKDGSLHGQIPKSPVSTWEAAFQAQGYTWPPTEETARHCNSKSWKKKLGRPLEPRDILHMPVNTDTVIRKRFPLVEKGVDRTLAEMVKCREVLENDPPIYRAISPRQCPSCDFYAICAQELKGRDAKSVIDQEYTRKDT